METTQLKTIIREVINEAYISDYLSPETIAKKTEFSPITIRRWCVSGELKATKFGRDWRVKTTDWIKFCDARTL